MPDNEKYPLALKSGTILAGRYIIDGVLGQGGFGITYKATDHQTSQSVAIKEYFPDSLAHRESTNVFSYTGDKQTDFEYGKENFLREAKTLAEFIGNPNIVRVYSYFEENNTAYFVMDYVEGKSFSAYLKENGGRISFEEAKRILLPIMSALSAVHAKGIIHRDISPDNIIITNDGIPKLLDFGAARYSLGDKSKSLDVILKHGFAPKEQYTRRGRQGPYTDVYSLGVTFYKAITGRIPPDSIDRMEEDDIINPTSLGANISPQAEEVLMKAMAVHTSDRYQSMDEFRRELELSSGPSVATSSNVIEFAPPVQPDTSQAFPQTSYTPPTSYAPPADPNSYNPSTSYTPQTPPTSYTPQMLSTSYTPQTSSTSYTPATSYTPTGNYTGTTGNGTGVDPVTGYQIPAPATKKKQSTAAIIVLLSSVAVLAIIVVLVIVLINNKKDDIVSTNTDNTTSSTESANEPLTSAVLPGGTSEAASEASAASEAESSDESSVSESKDSGSSYSFEDGTLTIYSDDFFTNDCEKFIKDNRYDLKHAIIKDGVTVIGDKAFYLCSNLETVTIPDGIKSVGENAFTNCSKISELTFPNTITSIDRFALWECTGIKSFTIPESVTTMEQSVFYGWQSDQTIYVKGRKSAPSGWHTYWMSTEFNAKVKWDSQGSSGETSASESSADSGSDSGDTYSYSNGTLTINSDKFFESDSSKFSTSQKDQVTTVVIKNGVTVIGNKAFYFYKNLSKITVPESVKSIGENAFTRTSLTSINIPEGVTKIDRFAFWECTSIKNITIPESVSTMGLSVFYGWKSDQTIYIKGKKSAPSSWSNMWMGSNCDAKVKWDSEGSSGETSEASESGSEAGDTYSFDGSTLTILSDSFYTNDWKTFSDSNQSKVTAVVIKKGVTKIGDKAFYFYKNLTKITIPEGIKTIGENAFTRTNLTSVDIPDGVISIDKFAFWECTTIKSITIPKSVTSIGLSVFYGWNSDQTIYVKGRSSAPDGWSNHWRSVYESECKATVKWNA